MSKYNKCLKCNKDISNYKSYEDYAGLCEQCHLVIMELKYRNIDNLTGEEIINGFISSIK